MLGDISCQPIEGHLCQSYQKTSFPIVMTCNYLVKDVSQYADYYFVPQTVLVKRLLCTKNWYQGKKKELSKSSRC